MEEKEKFRVFGAALDALDLPEKVALKQAYVRGPKLCQGFALDPYDAVKAALEHEPLVSSRVEWGGKIEVESWLTPRPTMDDERFLQRVRFTDFLDGNGCLAYSRKVKSYLEEQAIPFRPLMIGVDHSLTGGVIEHLASIHENLNVLVFDSHTDMVDFSAKLSSLTPHLYEAVNIYECGSFLDYLLEEKAIPPDRVWILGTQDLPDGMGTRETGACGRKLEDWTRRGVHLISKEALVRDGIPKDIEGPTYLSIDIDAGSYACVFACRFMDRLGLEYGQILDILHSLSAMIREEKIFLVGMDIMEIDVHFLDKEISGRRDCTLNIIKKIFDEVICRS